VQAPIIKQTKSYSAKKFAKGALFCPACRVRLESPEPACPTCGFTGAHTMPMFGKAAPAMTQILDVENVWTAAQRKALEKELAQMRQLFPQIHWCLLSVKLPPQADMRLFGFWFFNVSPVAADEDPDQRAWTILLTIDTEQQQLGLTPGYYIEPFLADDEWEKLLVILRTAWGKADAIAGYRAFFSELKQMLIRASVRLEEIIAHETGGEA
jgi:hypothetical protein